MVVRGVPAGYQLGDAGGQFRRVVLVGVRPDIGNPLSPERPAPEAVSVTSVDGPTLRAALGSTLYLVLIALLSRGIAIIVRGSAAGVGVVLARLYLLAQSLSGFEACPFPCIGGGAVRMRTGSRVGSVLPTRGAESLVGVSSSQVRSSHVPRG